MSADETTICTTPPAVDSPSFPVALPSFSLLTSMRWSPVLKDHPDCAYGAPFYLLSHHRERLLHAVKYFHGRGTFMEGAGKWDEVIRWLENKEDFERDMVEGIRDTNADLSGPLRVRVTLPIPSSSSPSPKFRLTTFSTPPLPVINLFPTYLPHPLHLTQPSSTASDWTLHIDTRPTIPTPLTRHKTTARRHYDFSRERCSLPPIGTPGANNEVIIYNPHGQVMEGTFTSLYFWRKDEGGWITPTLEAGGCEATVRKWLVDKGLAKEAVVKVGEVRRGEWVVMSNGVRGVWGGWVV